MVSCRRSQSHFATSCLSTENEVCSLQPQAASCMQVIWSSFAIDNKLLQKLLSMVDVMARVRVLLPVLGIQGCSFRGNFSNTSRLLALFYILWKYGIHFLWKSWLLLAKLLLYWDDFISLENGLAGKQLSDTPHPEDFSLINCLLSVLLSSSGCWSKGIFSRLKVYLHCSSSVGVFRITASENVALLHHSYSLRSIKAGCVIGKWKWISKYT